VFSSSWMAQGVSTEVWGHSKGLAVARAHGDVGTELLRPLLQHTQACLDAWGSSGVVADCSQSRMLITTEELRAGVLKLSARPTSFLAPTALVFRSDDLEKWQGYARMLADVGVVRGVFCDYDLALRWVAEQAAIFNADREHRARRIRAAAR